jgi:hypothetical protein
VIVPGGPTHFREIDGPAHPFFPLSRAAIPGRGRLPGKKLKTDIQFFSPQQEFSRLIGFLLCCMKAFCVGLVFFLAPVLSASSQKSTEGRHGFGKHAAHLRNERNTCGPQGIFCLHSFSPRLFPHELNAG